MTGLSDSSGGEGAAVASIEHQGLRAYPLVGGPKRRNDASSPAWRRRSACSLVMSRSGVRFPSPAPPSFSSMSAPHGGLAAPPRRLRMRRRPSSDFGCLLCQRAWVSAEAGACQAPQIVPAGTWLRLLSSVRAPVTACLACRQAPPRLGVEVERAAVPGAGTSAGTASAPSTSAAGAGTPRPQGTPLPRHHRHRHTAGCPTGFSTRPGIRRLSQASPFCVMHAAWLNVRRYSRKCDSSDSWGLRFRLRSRLGSIRRRSKSGRSRRR